MNILILKVLLYAIPFLHIEITLRQSLHPSAPAAIFLRETRFTDSSLSCTKNIHAIAIVFMKVSFPIRLDLNDV